MKSFHHTTPTAVFSRIPTKTAMLISVIALVSVTACQKTDNKPAANTTQAAEKSTSTPVATTPSVATSTTDNIAVASTAIPVEYPISTWQKQPITPLDSKDIAPIKALLGTLNRTDDKSLDFASNPATKYSFVPDSAPYLDLIDSPQFLEIGWYYANPTDTDVEKKQSTDNASKAYHITQGLLGKEGGKLVESILKGDVIKNETINGKSVELAKCEFYSCQVIIKK